MGARWFEAASGLLILFNVAVMCLYEFEMRPLTQRLQHTAEYALAFIFLGEVLLRCAALGAPRAGRSCVRAALHGHPCAAQQRLGPLGGGLDLGLAGSNSAPASAGTGLVAILCPALRSAARPTALSCAACSVQHTAAHMSAASPARSHMSMALKACWRALPVRPASPSRWARRAGWRQYVASPLELFDGLVVAASCGSVTSRQWVNLNMLRMFRRADPSPPGRSP